MSVAAPDSPFAAAYRLEGNVIGWPMTYQVRPDESLLEIARRADLGYDEITAANPGVDPFVPDTGSWIVLPTRWILPDVPIRKGIVINLAEMRLFLFPGGRSGTILTFPIGIGDQGKDSPLGTFTVVGKMKNPPWHVPESIRRERPDLPAVVPPGPDNPLGSHALRLSDRSLLIHGTNRPWGIGMRSSHGCIRLYPEDIPVLYRAVPRGTSVAIVNQPVKATVVKGRVYLEVHDYTDGKGLYGKAMKVVEAKRLAGRVDPRKIRKAAREKKGIPVDVTK